MTDERRRLDAVVHGRVQGVGFRVFVARRAQHLGLVGWVANDPDGSVRCRAEGPRADLAEFLAALREGPLGARVGSVTATWGEATGESDDFAIRAGGHPGD